MLPSLLCALTTSCRFRCTVFRKASAKVLLFFLLAKLFCFFFRFLRFFFALLIFVKRIEGFLVVFLIITACFLFFLLAFFFLLFSSCFFFDLVEEHQGGGSGRMRRGGGGELLTGHTCLRNLNYILMYARTKLDFLFRCWNRRKTQVFSPVSLSLHFFFVFLHTIMATLRHPCLANCLSLLMTKQ